MADIINKPPPSSLFPTATKNSSNEKPSNSSKIF
jgi:hypothetical protein